MLPYSSVYEQSRPAWCRLMWSCSKLLYFVKQQHHSRKVKADFFFYVLTKILNGTLSAIQDICLLILHITALPVPPRNTRFSNLRRGVVSAAAVMGVFTVGHGWIRSEWRREIPLYVWNEMEVDRGAICDRLTGSGGRLLHLCLGQSGVKLNRTRTRQTTARCKTHRPCRMYNWCGIFKSVNSNMGKCCVW